MTHAHHWLLETEAPSTYGTCKFCGERRFFEGHVEYSYRELNENIYNNTTALGFKPYAHVDISDYKPYLVAPIKQLIRLR